MITSSDQLMHRIKNLVGNNSAKIQIVMRLYAMERFLDRLACSPWKKCFIVKGGTLVTALVGVSLRTTMDIDATVNGIALREEEIEKVINKICEIKTNDYLTFHIKSVEYIMDERDYPGIRVSMEAFLDRARIPMKLDFSTGDAITPGAVEFGYPCLLEDGLVPIMAYNLETLLAEKLETIISRGTANTRMRDFYDVFVLLQMKEESIETSILKKAIGATFSRRGTSLSFENIQLVLNEIRTDARMKKMWSRYQFKSDYAQEITFEDTITAISRLANITDATINITDIN